MRAWTVLGVGVVSSCLQVGSERTARDLEVGHAVAEGLRVDVRDGAAAVRTLDAAHVQLWSNAPELELDLDPGAASREVELRVDNVLADVELGGAPVMALERPLPTELVARVRLDGPTRVTLHAPDRARMAPWRFLFFADVQEAIDRVQDLYRSMNAETDVRFALIGGDLTEGGTPDELERFEREMKSLRVPAFATLGNHELFDEDGIPYQARYGRASSHFDFRGVSFSLIDSASSSVEPRVYEWLDGWLDAGRDRLHVVAMHIPPLDPVGARAGSFASKMEAQKLLQRLVEGRVDLTLYGHVHSYYAFSNAGIPAFIAGGGGAIPERFDGVGRHYLVIDVDPTTERITTALRRID